MALSGFQKKSFKTFLKVNYLLILFINFIYPQSLSSLPNTPAVIGKEYFELNPALKLIYDSTFGETECSTSKSGDLFIQEFSGGDFKMIQHLNLDNTKYSVTQLEQELKILFMTAHSIKVTYNEPATLISFPILKNVKSHWSGIEYTNEEEADSISITSEYVSNEVLETEAGKFDCIKISYTITKQSGKVNKYYEWRSPNVGLVKLIAEVDPQGFVGIMSDILGIEEIYFILKDSIELDSDTSRR
jgi:hypothetical protein